MSGHSHSIETNNLRWSNLFTHDLKLCVYVFVCVCKRKREGFVTITVYGNYLYEGRGTPTLTFPTNGMRARAHNSFFFLMHNGQSARHSLSILEKYDSVMRARARGLGVFSTSPSRTSTFRSGKATSVDVSKITGAKGRPRSRRVRTIVARNNAIDRSRALPYYRNYFSTLSAGVIDLIGHRARVAPLFFPSEQLTHDASACFSLLALVHGREDVPTTSRRLRHLTSPPRFAIRSQTVRSY